MVPHEETILRASDLRVTSNLLPEGMNCDTLVEELFRFAVTNVVFLSPDDSLYRQLDGVSMGFPLGPSLTYNFMSSFDEQFRLTNCFMFDI